MPLPRVRFTVRRLMVAVAIVALVIFGVQMGRRRAEYQERLRFCEQAENSCRTAADEIANDDVAAREYLFDRTYFLEKAEHFAARKREYQYAASHPWVSVPPDPEEPW